MPSLSGATESLNSPPLTTAGPPGRVVPLGFAERGGVVSHTQQAAQCGRRARIVNEHSIAGPHGKAKIDALDDCARRW
jgi:hypothetical protein